MWLRQELGSRAEAMWDIRFAFGAEFKTLQERIAQLEKYAL